MKFLEPLIMGNPLLLEKSHEVDDILTSEIQNIISNMLYTVQSIGERVGLAAPQVGILKRIIVFRIPSKIVNPRYQSISNDNQEEIPWSAVINPTITALSDKKVSGWEGCISVPGMMGKVDRFDHISYNYYDEKGVFHEIEARGFHARLIQHEVDHLDGILFPMRISNMKDFGFESEIVTKE